MERVASALAGFRVINGYQLDYKPENKMLGIPEKFNSFPFVCYDVTGESSQHAGSTNSQQLKTTQLLFMIFLSSDNKKNEIVAMREQAISDINKFIMNDESISGQNTLRLELIQAMSYDIQTNHTTEYFHGTASIEATVNITYYDFQNDTLEAHN